MPDKAKPITHVPIHKIYGESMVARLRKYVDIPPELDVIEVEDKPKLEEWDVKAAIKSLNTKEGKKLQKALEEGYRRDHWRYS